MMDTLLNHMKSLGLHDPQKTRPLSPWTSDDDMQRDSGGEEDLDAVWRSRTATESCHDMNYNTKYRRLLKYRLPTHYSQHSAHHNTRPPMRGTTYTQLLDLPLEIRQQIWGYVLCKSKLVKIHRGWNQKAKWSDKPRKDRKKSLVLVSKKVSEEALDILYGQNGFIYEFGCDNKSVGRLFDGNAARVRTLLLVIAPSRYPLYYTLSHNKTWEERKSNIDHVAAGFKQRRWSMIFENLQHVRIIASGPFAIWKSARNLQATYLPQPAFTKEDAMKCWNYFLGHSLEFLIPKLSRVQRFEVDFNETAEIKEVIEKYMPTEWKEINHDVGEFVFMTGRSAIRFGPWDDQNNEYDQHRGAWRPGQKQWSVILHI